MLLTFFPIHRHKKKRLPSINQTTQRFNVGLVAITDVQNARAQYDTVLANEVTARNNLDNAVEQLRQSPVTTIQNWQR